MPSAYPDLSKVMTAKRKRKKGLSLYRIGKEMGVSPRTVQRWLRYRLSKYPLRIKRRAVDNL